LQVFVPVLLGVGSQVAHAHPVVVSSLAAPGDPAARRFATIIDAACRRHGVDQSLVHAIVFVESSYDPEAVSSQGALGLMQLMPVTAERYGVRDPLDPAQNIDAGVRFLKELLDLFDGDIELAVAAYNAGANAVIRAGYRIPENPETLAFVPRVLGHYQDLRIVASQTRADETVPMAAARDDTLRLPAADPADHLLRDRGLPVPERDERPVAIVSARRSSRWRLGRVRFSGAASSLSASPPDARDPKEARGAGTARRPARIPSAIPTTRRSAAARKNPK
jgi:hypothetical protein